MQNRSWSALRLQVCKAAYVVHIVGGDLIVWIAYYFCWDSRYGDVRWYVVEHHTAGADSGIYTHINVANDLAASGQQHPTTNLRVPITAGFAGATKSH